MYTAARSPARMVATARLRPVARCEVSVGCSKAVSTRTAGAGSVSDEQLGGGKHSTWQCLQALADTVFDAVALLKLHA
jgi:hypothetical protein